MIRAATLDDIPAVLVMGKAFADEAGVTAKVGWDDDTVTVLLTHLVESPDGVLFVGDNGMIGGLVFPHPFSGKLVFQELFWRAHGGEGLKLLKVAEDYAASRGAERSIMIGIDTMPSIDRLYARLNYEPMERLYSKEL